MDISLLYTETSNDSKLSASFTSALSSKQMGALLSHNDKDKIYIIAKYGDNKEQKIYSKEFNKKISDARQIFVKS